MDSSVLFRQLLRTPSPYRTFVQASIRPQTRTFALLASGAPPRFLSTNSLPRIVQPSFWASLIPKPFRSSPTTPPSPSLAAPKSQEWNPATPYIILGLLVGSQAIQILWLKRDHAHFMWRAEAKIGALREVVERVQRGEDVDVEAVLGKEGNEEEWKEVLKQIEEEELLFQSKKWRKAMRDKQTEQEAKEQAESEVKRRAEVEEAQEEKVKVETYQGVRFY